jgi:hypothetical protein
LSFFDDDGDEPPTAIRTTRTATRRPGSGGRRGTDDRTLLVRRAGAAVVALLVVVLVVLGVRAIIDHQATDALRTYAANVDSVVASEQGVRLQFFQQIDLAYNSPNQSAVANDIQQDVETEQSNYSKAQAWSVPAQMVAAQRQFVSVLGLRLQGLRAVENEIPTALGTNDQAAAIKQIAASMQLFLASDVLYSQRVQPLIQEALATAGISGQSVSPSQFLPDVSWLVPRQTATLILGYVPESLGGAPPSGSVGHELREVTYHGGVVLSTTQLNTIPLGAQGVTFTLEVLNSGTNPVHDVITRVKFKSLSVDASCLDMTSSIAVTDPGATYASQIVVSPVASCNSFFGVPLKMTADVDPVPGETDTSNNYQSFLVEFTH